MTPATALAPPAALTERIRDAVAAVLGCPAHSIAEDMPLTMYGLDSVSGLELVASLEQAVGCRLPEWFTAEHPTLGDLVHALDGSAPALDERAVIEADSSLPVDLHPPGGAPHRPARHVLLTGATGFLGAYLLRELLHTSDAHVHCLVRGAHDRESGVGRVRRNLERYRLWDSHFEGRMTTISGDVTASRLGLRAEEYAALADVVDVVYHAAGDVSWVQPYAALRATNVSGTIEVLRFVAAGRAKSLQFLSSLSVCFASGGPSLVDEHLDMLPFVHDLALGYAKTKLVAESLVRQAQRRGFDVRVYRPSIIVGDAATGASNLDDIVAALLKGCIAMGAAPDLDWVLDGPPVDHVARAVVRLAGRPSDDRGGVTHLYADRPRHWRECVLWTNLFGYPVRLVPFATWQTQLREEGSHPGHPLHALRQFFLRPVSGSLTSAELFEERRRSATARHQSREFEASVGLVCPRLDAWALDRYFADYTDRGFLPEAPIPDHASRPGNGPSIPLEGRFRHLLSRHFSDPHLRINDCTVVDRGSDHSIVSELTSWRRDQAHGLCHFRLSLASASSPGSLDVVAKSKPCDDDVIGVAETLAGVCDAGVAEAMHVLRHGLGLRASHLREQGVYAAAPEVVRAHLPMCFGAWRDDGRHEHGLLLEKLVDIELLDAADDPGRWTQEYRDIAVAGLARLHAAWHPMVPELCREGWIGDLMSAARMKETRPLWRALARHAAPYVADWTGNEVVRTHHTLVESVDEWWPALEDSPRTLIHHDFNPRNICLRHTNDGLQLCAYDWELATIGAPQRDVVEFLCFTLDSGCARAAFERHVEDHRVRLAAGLGTPIEPDVWQAGVRSALGDFLIRRLAFYVLVHRVRAQRFLPRVIRTWAHLYALTSGDRV